VAARPWLAWWRSVWA